MENIIRQRQQYRGVLNSKSSKTFLKTLKKIPMTEYFFTERFQTESLQLC